MAITNVNTKRKFEAVRTYLKERSLNDQFIAQWENASGMTYEWQINETRKEYLPGLVINLEEAGCSVYNVDTSKEPYYYVSIRFIVPIGHYSN